MSHMSLPLYPRITKYLPVALGIVTMSLSAFFFSQHPNIVSAEGEYSSMSSSSSSSSTAACVCDGYISMSPACHLDGTEPPTVCACPAGLCDSFIFSSSSESSTSSTYSFPIGACCGQNNGVCTVTNVIECPTENAFIYGASCTPNNPCPPPPVCGDGMKEGNEKCDGSDFGSKDCAFYGFYGEGSLTCDATCTTITTESCTYSTVSSSSAPFMCCTGWVNGNGVYDCPQDVSRCPAGATITGPYPSQAECLSNCYAPPSSSSSEPVSSTPATSSSSVSVSSMPTTSSSSSVVTGACCWVSEPGRCDDNTTAATCPSPSFRFYSGATCSMNPC